ncbi:MAG: CPBP family intramembrane metalloprotease [Candidatus Helarchaeota archaeon]|nr:CPBP family intramembrane metalloprotease [Candidatus Helarchaeota archaeon]
MRINSFWRDQLVVVGVFIGIWAIFYFCDFGWNFPLDEPVPVGASLISAIPIIPVLLSFILLIPLYWWVYKHPRKLEHYEKQDLKSIILVFLLIFVLIMIFRTLILLKYGLPLEKTPMLFLIVLQIIFLEGFYLSDFGFHSNKFWRQVGFTFALLSIVGLLVIVVFSAAVFSLALSGILDLSDLTSTPLSINWYGLASFPFQLLCVGISEELIFRGYFYTKLRSNLGYIKSILISSIIFGLFHMAWYIDPNSPWFISDWSQMASHVGSTFIFGVCMCIIYERTQSLICPILIHGLFNSVGTAFASVTAIEISFEAQMWLYGLVGGLLVPVFFISVIWILPRLTKWVGVEAEKSIEQIG